MDLLASPQILNGRRFNYPICINIKSSEQIKRLSISYHYPNRCMCTRNFVIRHSPICHYICLLSIFNVRPLRSPWCARALGVAVRHRLAAGRERPGPRASGEPGEHFGLGFQVWIAWRLLQAAAGTRYASATCHNSQAAHRPTEAWAARAVAVAAPAGGARGASGARREG